MDEAELKSEAEKLGPNARERITAVQNFLAAQLGPDRAGDLNASLVTAKQVESFERLIANTRTQERAAAIAAATATPSHARAEPPPGPGKVSEEQFQKMSPAARLDYVRQFAQPATNGTGR
jgi:endonuclease/exonuclease/phosphatase family metal-dependent hydrolase